MFQIVKINFTIELNRVIDVVAERSYYDRQRLQIMDHLFMHMTIMFE